MALILGWLCAFIMSLVPILSPLSSATYVLDVKTMFNVLFSLFFLLLCSLCRNHVKRSLFFIFSCYVGSSLQQSKVITVIHVYCRIGRIHTVLTVTSLRRVCHCLSFVDRFEACGPSLRPGL